MFFPILVLIVSLIVSYHIFSVWRGLSLYQVTPSKENLLKAVRVTPSNPDPYYRLGLFYEWDLQNVDLRKSLDFFREAAERNPLEQQYWLNMAKVFLRVGEKEASEKTLEKAVFVYPTSYQGRWITGNLLLQQGAIDKALPHFSYLLSHYPNQSGLVYDVLQRAIGDTEFILGRIVPKDSSSLKQYLAYLYETGDKESVRKAWGRKASFGYQEDRKETLRYIEFLISQGEFTEAFEVWKARLQEEKILPPSDGNLITNGGFEKEKILGGGFDWKIEEVKGAHNSLDRSIAFEGKSSLKIVFNGKENIDFFHVYQFVPLKPGAEYLLKARAKTKDVTTKSGVKIEVFGTGPAFGATSESLVGDKGWTELMVSFRTPARSQGGVVRIRREKTDKFDRLISGTVWIDDVRLIEKNR